MEQEGKNEALLRKYLLGELNEADEQALEEELLADDELSELLLAEEDELVDDYLGRKLSEGERERFDNHFMVTPERQRKLSFGRALKSYKPRVVAIPVSEDPGQDPAAEEPGANEPTAKDPGTKEPPPNMRPTVVKPPSTVLIGPTSWWGRASSSTYVKAATIVIALGLGFGTWRAFISQSEIDEGVAALARAYGNERPTDARISGWSYAPRENTRGITPGKTDKVARDQAESLIFSAAKDDAQSFHALALLYLARHDFPTAKDQFEKALALDPNNAQLHSDYGAALLEYGRTVRADGESGSAVEAFAKSLQHLNRALTLNPRLPEGMFNRALLHEQMTLEQRAMDDWRSYLERDSISPWADEARQHLDRLQEGQRKIGQRRETGVDDFLSAYRERDEEAAWMLFSADREKLMTGLLTAYLKGVSMPMDNIRHEALAALAYAGELDAQHTGDQYAAHLVRFYASASSQQLAKTSQAREIMVQAERLYGSSKTQEAAAAYGNAEGLLIRAGDQSGAQLARFWLGLCYWELMQTNRGRNIWLALLRNCEENGHRWLEARTLNMLSGIAFKEDEYSRAIAYSSESRKLARDVNDISCAFAADSALIEYYRLVGNREECMAQIGRGLPEFGRAAIGIIPVWRYYDLVATAHATFEQYDAAIAFEREALSVAAAANDFVLLASSNSNLGLMYGKARAFEPAFRHTEQAYEIAAAHADKPAGQLQMAYAKVATGQLYRERGELDRALTSYDQGVSLHRANNLDFSVHLYQAYKGRLACLIGLHNAEAAREQLALLLMLVDKQRTAILEEENRNNFFAAEQSVYDMGIELAHSQMHNDEEAFGLAEASHARSLLDSLSASAVKKISKQDPRRREATQPLQLADIQRRCPDTARMLYYAVLDDKVLIWVVSRDESRLTDLQISQAALNDLVMRYCSLITTAEAGHSASEQLSRELFGYLIAPIESLLGGSKSLYIVPDKILNRLPWDALISGKTGRFVAQDYNVTVAPSATLFAKLTDLASQRAGARDEYLAGVGDPSFDRAVFPQLERLTDAVDEVARIRSLYTFGSKLLGASAREESVREELPRADVLHFALHCVVNERSAMRSTLLLAREAPGVTNPPMADGLLQACEIYDMSLPRARLAVLSACQSGVERYYRGEGMIGMARAFMVAQVPLIVASLWPVDSTATAELMVRFHKYRRVGGLSTNEALRNAKLELLSGEGPLERYRQPVYWAGFQLIGGAATF